MTKISKAAPSSKAGTPEETASNLQSYHTSLACKDQEPRGAAAVLIGCAEKLLDSMCKGLYTYACNDVQFKRKDNKRAWSPVKCADPTTMYWGYPYCEFIPGTKGDQQPIRYGDFVIDIETMELARNAALQITQEYENIYIVDPEQWRVYLFGEKGAYLEIPAEILGTENGHTWLTIVRKILHHLVHVGPFTALEAQARQHLRREHIRRLSSGNIWVNACVVGDPSKGKINKSYEVRA